MTRGHACSSQPPADLRGETLARGGSRGLAGASDSQAATLPQEGKKSLESIKLDNQELDKWKHLLWTSGGDQSGQFTRCNRRGRGVWVLYNYAWNIAAGESVCVSQERLVCVHMQSMFK